MKVSEIKAMTVKMIERDAYSARVLDELYTLGFEVGMMKFHRDEAYGKAFGAMEILTAITGTASDPIYEKAVDSARMDILNANYNIVKLLDLAGFNGAEYYKAATR